MCYAVQSDRPLWKNTNVTAKEIRQVFRLSPCLICALAKIEAQGRYGAVDVTQEIQEIAHE